MTIRQNVNNTLHTMKSKLNRVMPGNVIRDEQPLRSELFSVEQFKTHARFLAGRHNVNYEKGKEKLLSRLKKNKEIIQQTYELLNDAGKGKRTISPAGEWLLDNYYLIEEQIMLAKKHLPKVYSMELPNLSGGPMSGFPRIYDIAMEIVSHGDGRLDVKGLTEFVASYQTVKHLKLGELWGIPIMIRLALIENLRRVSSYMMLTQIHRDKAGYWADRIIAVSGSDTNDMVHEVAEMSKDDLPLSDSFVSEFVRRLHGQSTSLNLPLIWLEKKLSDKGTTIDRLIQVTGQKQASNQVTIANTIESLRLLERTDWHDFVEELSVVEKELGKDPAGKYREMSFETRDSYRHVIEKLSAQWKITELEAAQKAVALAYEAEEEYGRAAAAAHVGYYLADNGLEKMYKTAGRWLPLSMHLKAKKTFLPLLLYAGGTAVLTLFFSAAGLFLAFGLGMNERVWLVLFGIALIFTSGQTSVSLVNWLSTLLVKPTDLPRMDYSNGIPKETHAITVIPTLLGSLESVKLLLENLEVTFLANSDPKLDFALLTDFADAKEETLPEDSEFLSRAAAGITKLNEKYASIRNNIFYLFHRPRKWNEREKIWMGHERKRGKLSDLNAMLRGCSEKRFSEIVGDVSMLQDVKYVITLDTDTRMPRDGAKELISVIAHPLNRPRFDALKKRVVSGYGILQPRVESEYPGENPSLFVKIFGGESGIDPYTRSVSDVYQDLFHEGSFIGKGLYDVDAFEAALKDRMPENLILSHDLLEGCYVRSGLVTDVQLFEKFPTGYLKDVSRRRRWIRGDWQIASWLFGRVAGPGKTKEKNPVSFLSKLKIYDNLRRSLVPASTVFLILSGWMLFLAAWPWTLFIILLSGLPIPLITLAGMMRKPEGVTGGSHAGTVFSSLLKGAAQFFFNFCFIVYEAYYSLEAVLTTFGRMIITKKKLLEWTTSIEAEMQAKKNIFDMYRRMFIAPVVVLVCLTAGKAVFDPASAVLMVFWILSPAAAYFISLPRAVRRANLTTQKKLFLRKISRKTWNFFETFFTAEDNWLVPDNFQEEPAIGAAHRTSPTNIGLSLLSNLAAYDFGYVSMGMMLNRSQKTLNVMNALERYKGHFFNWYDTKNLKPLEPRYISSVDSGNLHGHLLVLRAGLMELRSSRIVPLKLFDGIKDTLEILDESSVKDAEIDVTGKKEAAMKIAGHIGHLREKLEEPPVYLSETHSLLRQLSGDVSRILSAAGKAGFENTRKWARVFEKQCYDCLEDMAFIAPWLSLPPEIPDMWELGSAEQKQKLNVLRTELGRLDEIPVLEEAARLEREMVPMIDAVVEELITSGKDGDKSREWFMMLKNAVKEGATHAGERITAVNYTALLCGEMSDVEYGFLYDDSSHFLSVGYNVSVHKKDASYYDLLASEARLSSYVAIAKGKMPQEHWFNLGRLLSKRGGGPVLVSWGGSMFEYLMPLLVMPSYEGTLLDRTYSAIVARQIEYGYRNNIPWGISESGYNKLDTAMNYQYRSFGVPDTGFKRGLSEDLVIAPYATALALMVDPERACSNLERMRGEGFCGEYGFYEAVDYTPSRLEPDAARAVIKSYMAHHQGMSFLAFAYTLLDRPMQRRFLSDPMFKATDLLLQERVADDVPYLYDAEISGTLRQTEEREALLRVYTNPDTVMPETHLLSNGNYNVMVTNSGGGYSRYKNISVTRWSEDAVSENQGTFIYLKDFDTGEFWSNAYQPALKKSKRYEAVFSRSRAEFKRSDFMIDTHTEIAVSPEDDIELRRVSVTNRSRKKRVIEVTSYAEAVLNYPAADLAHRVFSNLFVETEIIRSHQAIICKRRARSDSEKFPLMFHLMAVHGKTTRGASYETDRSKFIGRLNTLENPDALFAAGNMSDSEGAVLDPCVSIRCRVELEPEETAVVDYVTGICSEMKDAQRLMEKYRDRNLADRVFSLAWTSGQVALQQINATETDAQLYGRLASAIIFANPAWRAAASILSRNFRGQPDLWGYSISGDLPIVLVRIEDRDNLELISRMVHAHSYWRMHGLAVDLVIWNEDHSVYRDEMSGLINGLIAENSGAASSQPGGIFLRRADQMSEEDKILMQTVARVIITDRGGTLSEQLERRILPKIQRPKLEPSRKADREKAGEGIAERTDLSHYNGTGGFTRDGREYVITTGKGRKTPAPWVNVLANKNFGTVVTESGGGYTWSENAHEFRLTPWKNDAITDAGGEAVYIRDEETGKFWSASPMPAPGDTLYVSRHGFGYTIFEHMEQGLVSEMTVFTAVDLPVKFCVLKLKNVSGRRRSFSITVYNELVMGTDREKSHMHIVTETDPKSGALLAHNHYNKEFPGRVVFLDSSETAKFVSCDRSEFIGRNRTAASPAAMLRDKLSGKTGAGFDPAACMQVKIELNDGEERETSFSFGSAKSSDEARGIIQRFSGMDPVKQELSNVWEFWKKSLGAIYVETPDDSLNFMVNGWLQYQVIASRLWGRSGYYQSGGAYGYRDQLQDAMALTHSHPWLVREQLIKFAGHQFAEGDVLHWWHPPSGRGIRSTCSDDYLWLPMAACLYSRETGDKGVWDEVIPYIEGPQVKPGEESYYGLPQKSDKTGTLYEHCAAAVRRGLKFGSNGLPLIGGGDWNDGMNLVGHGGKGESVWLGFFLFRVLVLMSALAEQRGDMDFSSECRSEAEKLSRNIEKNGWDGEWYRRAYFDDGSPMGAAGNSECMIDSIPQSWAVISGASGERRAKTAMENVDRMLVDRKNSLIKLFTPPFDKGGGSNPGYIKGYVPGVRENGGQYTHAAVWAAMAFAMLKDNKRAWELVNMINPVRHADSPEKTAVYKTEPYVMAADIYALKQNAGRGGWTWYTGSASWMYRLIVENLLGLKREGETLLFEPCLPEEWKSFAMHYRYRETFYHINIHRAGSGDRTESITVDGVVQDKKEIKLYDDRAEHRIEIVIGMP